MTVPNRDRLLQQSDDPKMRDVWRMTDAYRDAALEVLLRGAGDVIKALGLPQKLPITRADIVEYAIMPPYLSDHMGFFGTLSTREYVLTARFGNRITFVSRNFRLRDDEQEYTESLQARYELPMSMINTNAAYTMATQWLAAISADVAALSQACTTTISALELGGGRFVPIYKIEWEKWETKTEPSERVAHVELVGPEQALVRLWVDRPEYLKGKSLAIKDRETLLSTTNSPPREVEHR